MKSTNGTHSGGGTDTADGEFTREQKEYLQGFVHGSELARNVSRLPSFASTLAATQPPANGASTASGGPSAGGAPAVGDLPESIHRRAQDRWTAAGGRLCAEEAAKREKNPLDMWDEMRANAATGSFPKGTDVFLYKFHGLFYVAPAQDSFMCRLRLPGGILSAHQLRGIAGIAERLAGGYAHVTTRANLQVREIRPESTIEVLTSLQELGVVTRGAGADNIRNITGSPTAGIDRGELIDTRPLARELHHSILNHRELYGLPRKFNIAFDGGGLVSVLEDTNDIGFAAVRVGRRQAVPAGVYFRMQLGGITGHKDFARDTGVLLEPAECVRAATAVVRVFIEHGDRTDRKKARLKYLLDRWGFERFLEEVEKHYGEPLRRFPLAECELPAPASRHGHVGFHEQKQRGLFYVGVVLPVGRLSVEQMRGLERIAETYGDGAIRLTVWQNLILSGIPGAEVDAVKRGLEALSLDWRATSFRAGLVACTGNGGCRFAASDTKGHAMKIADRLESRLELDQPLNIHLTGCHHSCAQHYIGDIGLLATGVEHEGRLVEGYHVYLGGGYGRDREIGREVFRNVPESDIPDLLERMVRVYLRERSAPRETFQEFTRRHPDEDIVALVEGEKSRT